MPPPSAEARDRNVLLSNVATSTPGGPRDVVEMLRGSCWSPAAAMSSPSLRAELQAALPP